MAERKNQGKTPARTGKSKSGTPAKSRSKKSAEAEAQRIREEAFRRSQAQRRVWSVILFAAGIILELIAIIPGSEGDGWRVLYNVIHGLFGIGSYAIGPAMIYAAIVISGRKKSSEIRSTVIKLGFTMLIICAIVEIFGIGKVNGENFFELIKNLYISGMEFRGGGVFALFVGVPLLFLGKLGAGIIIIVVALVCVFLLTNLTFEDIGLFISGKVSDGREKHREKRRAARERDDLLMEEYDRLEAERAERDRQLEEQLAEDRKRFQAEIDEEQRVAEKIEQMKKIVDSVEPFEESDEVPEFMPEPAPKKRGRNSAEGNPPQPEQPPKQDNPRPKHPEQPLPEQARPEQPQPEQAQPEAEPELSDLFGGEEQTASEDYREALLEYMMKRHPVMREDEQPEKDPLEDEDAELVSIMDALNKFKNDHSEPARVSKIMDAPAQDVTTSDDISAVDEAELPFDLDDILKEPPVERTYEEGPPVPRPAPPRERTPKPAPKPAEMQRSEQIRLSELYSLPPVDLLNPVKARVPQADIDIEIRKNANKLVETLQSFGVSTTYTGASRGPSVTRYELQPAPGVKISKITNLADDIALNLASSGVRIAPIPNKAAVGIEVPNDHRDTVFFRELIDTPEFRQSYDKKLLSVLGKDISGKMVSCNVGKMPHLLIAGTTGSGKSVCVNSIIMSILMKSTPDDVKLIMVDPKQVEFMMYNGIPHLLIPVVTDPKKAAGALAWSVNEMERRYTLFSENNVRNIDGYNELAEKAGSELERMPNIVIFIDELADLMMASPKDVEDSIVRLAQKARAAGMHLVIATQKPTVQVVTGLIKGNIPSRIALMVASQVDSRVILDASGAEKLLGNGDMLYQPVGVPKPIRLQGCYVADEEVERVVEHIKGSFAAEYDESIMAEIERQTEIVNSGEQKGASADDGDEEEADEKLEEAIELAINAGQISASALQRHLKLGYGRASRLIDIMDKMGIISGFEGSKPRKVLITKQEWYERKLRR